MWKWFKTALRQGANVNAPAPPYGDIALVLATRDPTSMAVIELLLDVEDIDVNLADQVVGITALMQAVLQNNTELVRLFLDQKGIDVNRQNKAGKTALDYAKGYVSKPRHEEIIRMLEDASNKNN